MSKARTFEVFKDAEFGGRRFKQGQIVHTEDPWLWEGAIKTFAKVYEEPFYTPNGVERDAKVAELKVVFQRLTGEPGPSKKADLLDGIRVRLEKLGKTEDFVVESVASLRAQREEDDRKMAEKVEKEVRRVAAEEAEAETAEMERASAEAEKTEVETDTDSDSE